MIDFLRRFSLSVFVTKIWGAYGGGDNRVQKGIFITACSVSNYLKKGRISPPPNIRENPLIVLKLLLVISKPELTTLVFLKP